MLKVAVSILKLGAPTRTRTAIAGLQNRNISLYTIRAKLVRTDGIEPLGNHPT